MTASICATLRSLHASSQGLICELLLVAHGCHSRLLPRVQLCEATETAAAQIS